MVARLTYYGAAACRDMLPYAVATARHKRRLRRVALQARQASLLERIAYYNKLNSIDPRVLTVSTHSVSRKMSRYYYDFMAAAKGFGKHKRLNYLFGDVVEVPDRPTFVRSRPIHGENANSVLLKLDRLRHFRFPPDPQSFHEKRSAPVWRGAASNPTRRALLRAFGRCKSYDIGHRGSPFEGLPGKDFLTIADQRRYRYIISIEGNDVATNLKWILASNSLCFATPLRFETWFMEGRLRPGVHFVELRPDFSDLEEKVRYYNENPSEAVEIIAAAHDFIAQFFDRRAESAAMMLVFQKYFEISGQLPTAALPLRVF
ncbi:MAG: glycosyl transferase family 90 [Rhodospirillales bacterium]